MDKRLAKRHKRQVTRAKEKVKLSEPDLRTPEELKAAREVSQAVTGGRSADTPYAAASTRGHSRPTVNSAAKADA